jgi:hypothetical protein
MQLSSSTEYMVYFYGTRGVATINLSPAGNKVLAAVIAYQMVVET